MLSMQIYNFSLKERREFQKNNVSLQLLVPISAIYSQIHIIFIYMATVDDKKIILLIT